MSFDKQTSFNDTVLVLIEGLSDKEFDVTNAIGKSLNKVIGSHPNEAIDIFCYYLENKKYLSNGHLANIVGVLEQACVRVAGHLTSATSETLAKTVLSAMIQANDYEPLIQITASSVLVAVGHYHYDTVLLALISELKQHAVPHYTIPHTLGTLAAVNTAKTVPHIKDILSRMIPQLTMVKSDGMKQAFSYAFGHFAVAVCEQIGDNTDSEYTTNLREIYVVEFSIIFEVLFNQWLNSHESKVAEAVLEALGPITRLIPEEKFETIINKFIPTLLSLYRRNNVNAFYVSQCISYLLTPTSLNPKLSFSDSLLNLINTTLYNFILLEPDYDQPQSIKNHFELLRCFDYLSGLFPDHTMDYLLLQCKNNNEKERMKAVIVLTHLTTSSQMFVDKYAEKFIALLKLMIPSESNVKMKKIIVKAIAALVYRQCLVNDDDFAIIEFIIKNCSYNNTNVSFKVEVRDLQDTCKNSLFLLCTTVVTAKDHLRVLLLNALLSEDFTASCGTIAQCLTHLYQKHDDKEPLNFTIVSPENIFIRCLIYFIDNDNVERNKNLIQFLDVYCSEINKNFQGSWQVDLQRLLKYVDKDEPQSQWHQMLLELLLSAIELANNSKWVESLAIYLSQQVLPPKLKPIVRGVSMQYLALISCHIANTAIVHNLLNIIVVSIRSMPREGSEQLSKAAGIASRQHGTYIYNELLLMYKELESKRGNKFLNFLSAKTSKSELEAANMRYILIHCYGQIAKECSDTNVLTSLCENVTVIINDILKVSPDIDMCRACLTSLYCIAKALEPSGDFNIVMRNRWPLLNVVLDQLFNTNIGKRNIEIFPLIVKTAKALTKLQKGILPEERNTILRVFITTIFNELSLLKKKFESGDSDDNNSLAKTLNDTLTMLHQLEEEFILQSTCLSTVDDLVTLISEWLTHENEEIRSAAVVMLNVIFKAYLKNVKINYETPSKFSQMGFLLGLLLPGCTDSNFSVRLTTIDNIKLVIHIHYLYEGHSIDNADDCIKYLDDMHNNILTNDMNLISNYCTDIANAISDKVPHHQLLHFIDSLLSRYQDIESVAVGISAVLDVIFKKKGQDLYQNIEKVMDLILLSMESVEENVGDKLLKPVVSLGHHHVNAVTAVLLAQPLPAKRSVIKCWHHLAQDQALAKAIVQNFLRMMTSIKLFEEPTQYREPNIAALQPLTVVNALGEMFEEQSMEEICMERFADVFALLYTSLACYTGAAPPAYTTSTSTKGERFGFIPNRDAMKLSPGKIVLNALSKFLMLVKCEKVKEACWLYTHTEEGDTVSMFVEVVPLVTGALCREAGRHLPRLAAALAAYLRSPLLPQRIAAFAFFAEVLQYRCNDNPVLLETVMAALNSGWKDTADDVKVISLRGIAGIGLLKPEICSQYLPGVVAALSEGIDGQQNSSVNDNVPLAAIQGLCRLLNETSELESESLRELRAVAQKIKPFMNTDCSALREASIRLFGIITSCVRHDLLQEQALMSLPCFLLHLCDEDASVVRASKFTLKKMFILFDAKKANLMVQTHLLEEGRLYHEEFLLDLMKNIVEEMPKAVHSMIENSFNYLSSNQPGIKAYACLMIGILYAELNLVVDKDQQTHESDSEMKARVLSRLVNLMKDSNARVRQHCALALGNICLVLPKLQNGTQE